MLVSIGITAAALQCILLMLLESGNVESSSAAWCFLMAGRELWGHHMDFRSLKSVS